MNDSATTTSSDEVTPVEPTGEPGEIPEMRRLDTIDDRPVATAMQEETDMGYNVDTGDSIYQALPIYPGEVIDDSPGRGSTGTLDNSDSDDWYSFSVCTGQQIQVSIQADMAVAMEISNPLGEVVATSEAGTSESLSHDATTTGRWFLHLSTDAGAGSYELDVTLAGQNDAGSGDDAGDTLGSALAIAPGTHEGYLDRQDWYDFYSFQASAGQGIIASITPPERTDFDIHLYNPAGERVHYASYYGPDELEYPADATGTWTLKVDIFPGWDTSLWPDDYYLYGSGTYKFTLEVGGSAEAPPGPIPQPDVTPVAQTFKIADDPDSNADEYGYLAAVPAANYLDGGQRYVSPIVYENVDDPTHWFGTIDDTTQYLLDDWNTYLDRHGMTAEEYMVPSDPVQAAAQIATDKWDSTDTAVVVPVGSEFTDETTTVIDSDATLNVQAERTTAAKDSSQLKDIGGKQALPMFVGSKWAAMTIYAEPTSPGLGVITPRYEVGTEEDWPHPYDGPGDNTNIYFPITIPGLWFPYAAENSGDWTLEVTKYTGDRHKISVDDASSSLQVTVTTDEPSHFKVFLVDPRGNIRRPSVPHWNDPAYENINPLHIWNGYHNPEIGFEEWRRWESPATAEQTLEVHYPLTGDWTVIVAPHYPYGEEKTSDSIDYHITASVRQHSQQRTNAALSAANGAVLASLNHAPLLYVTADEIPAATQNALDTLGASNIIFVNLGEISTANPGGTTYTTMQQVVDAIKQNSASENYITVTSLGTGDGYFAPAAMIAAYHGSPVLNLGEIPETYDLIDKATAWREYAGGWYHGMRAQAHLSMMAEPFDFVEMLKGALQGNIPDPGFDMHQRWYGGIQEAIEAWITDYGLAGEGQEAYMFVADRENDIRHLVMRSLSGNESFAGQIPFDTPAMDTNLICRDILYPAIIYANPGRDVSTSQLMNYPDGTRYSRWDINNGETVMVYSSRSTKESFSSHDRFYEGHCVWDNMLERYNAGACVNYYAGHGTGGSGVSAQFKCIADQFPYAEHYVNNPHTVWWDSWRGYSGYDGSHTSDASYPRWGGTSWYNAQEPGLYDIIHFKWVDRDLDNLHSLFELWMSCTTGQHFGPDVYLEHGAALWYGNAGTGSCPPGDYLDDIALHEVMVNGASIGEAYSKNAWLIYRDYTTDDPASVYGWSSLQISHIQVIFGDPTMTVYSPEWTEPTPIEA
ncbi:MAG: hypothetical protein ACP5FL_03505 [Thermoplasmatota archaeon]